MTGRSIQRVAVIGSGTMGGGIAALFANAGVPVFMLDVSQQVVAASHERLKKNKPPAFFTPETAELVTFGSLDEHEAWISEADWIIEAIFEDMATKKSLVARIDRLRRKDSIVTSNTSGLPIAKIAAETSADFKAHFLGTHFFNPPRYMKLLEIIPTKETNPDITAFVRDFAERRLGKGVVMCKDTPNFIANRLGSMAGAMLLDFVLANNYTVEEVDGIAGPLIGRPKTAAFRLQDLVGLDVAASVGSNLYGLIEGDESREVLHSPHIARLRKSQMDKGRLGDKTGQGFYKKGGQTIQTLDIETGEYRERREPDIPSIAAGLKIRPLAKRLEFVLEQDDKAGALARYVIYNTLAYAARRVPEITDDIINVDRAMRWGFSHDLGPFELWDALGVRSTVEAMKKDGIAVAPWVTEMLAAGNESFYGHGQYYDPVRRTYVAIQADPLAIRLADQRVVKENKGASLRDIGDGVLCLEFHTKMNTLDDDIRAMIVEAVAELERGPWTGMVIGNDGADFCVGANLAAGFGANGSEALNRGVKAMQDALMAVRFSAKPIVAAPFGRTLGGGAEVAMAAARIVAASETYMGLVEVGVGLIPGAGGCKELVRRVVSPAMKQTPNADPVPFLQNVMQTIGTAKVSSSAEEARSFGFLAAADHVVMNRDHLIAEAKHEVIELSHDYAPPVREKNCYAAGRDVRAALRAGIYVLQQGAYMSEYDALLTSRLATILCGGDLSSGQWVDEQFFLDRERETFVALCHEPKTLERIQYMLANGKPLRN
ncbi:MAG: 3-hydroxyacyl-CoA dehydrogenase/enoyl-CoA hydratase family protein [Thermoanaerobaculia bacterium]